MQVLAYLIGNSKKRMKPKLQTIRMVSPAGLEVVGTQTDDDNDTIIWKLTSALPRDGSADGTYTINVSAVDKVGGSAFRKSTG